MFSRNWGLKTVPFSVRITSERRSMTTRWPSSVRYPASPVCSHPSPKVSCVASGLSQYPAQTASERRRISPASLILTSVPGMGRPTVSWRTSPSRWTKAMPMISVWP